MSLYHQLIKVAATVNDVACKKIYHQIFDQNGNLTDKYKNNFVGRSGNYICLKFNKNEQDKFIDAADKHVSWCVLSKSFAYYKYLNCVKQNQQDDKKQKTIYGNYYYILENKKPMLKKCDDLPSDYKINENNQIYTQKYKQFVGKPLWKIQKNGSQIILVNPKTKQQLNQKNIDKQLLNDIKQQIQIAKQDGYKFVNNKFVKIQKKLFSYVNDNKKYYLYKNGEYFYNNKNEPVQVINNSVFIQQNSEQLQPKCLVIVGQLSGQKHTQIRDTQDKFFTQKLTSDISNLLQKAIEQQQNVFTNLDQNKVNKNDLKQVKQRLGLIRDEENIKKRQLDEISKYIKLEKFYNASNEMIQNAKFQKYNQIQVANINNNIFFKQKNEIQFMFFEKQFFVLKRGSKLTQDALTFIQNNLNNKIQFQRVIYLSIQQNYIGDDTIQFCLNNLSDNPYILTQIITRRYIFKTFPRLSKQDELAYNIIKLIVQQDIKNNQMFYTFKMLQTTQKIQGKSVRQIIVDLLKDNKNEKTAQFIKNIYDNNDIQKQNKNESYAGYSDKVDKLKDMFKKLLYTTSYNQQNFDNIINYIKIIAQAESQKERNLDFAQASTKISHIKRHLIDTIIVFLQLSTRNTKISKQKYRHMKKIYDELLSQNWFIKFIAKDCNRIKNILNKIQNNLMETQDLEKEKAIKNIYDKKEEMDELNKKRYNNPFFSLYKYNNPQYAARQFCLKVKSMDKNVVLLKQTKDINNYKKIIQDLLVIFPNFVDLVYEQFQKLYPEQSDLYNVDKQCQILMNKNVDKQYIKWWINQSDLKSDDEYFCNKNFFNLLKNNNIEIELKSFLYSNPLSLTNAQLDKISNFTLYQVAKKSTQKLLDEEYFKKILDGRVKIQTIVQSLTKFYQAAHKNSDKKFLKFVKQKIQKTIDKLNYTIKNKIIIIPAKLKKKIKDLYLNTILAI